MVRATSRCILVQEKSRLKARSNRALEQKNNKSRVEEGVNADNIKYEEETTSDMSITMDTDGPGI